MPAMYHFDLINASRSYKEWVLRHSAQTPRPRRFLELKKSLSLSLKFFFLEIRKTKATKDQEIKMEPEEANHFLSIG